MFVLWNYPTLKASIQDYKRRIKEKDFSPHEVCYMKPEEICPEKWKEVITKHMKKFEYAYEAKEVATTSHFKCSKCKKREVTYVEVQLRAGDEGSTLLFTCQSCGHKWRM